MSNPILSWRRVRALCVKETRQIVRDPSSWLIAVVIPLLLLFIFGYGINLDSSSVSLDPANFDAAKVNALIDASALDAATKTTLKSGVDAAASNAALVPGAIEAVKKALGL